MNGRRVFAATPPSAAVAADLARLEQSWSMALARSGGPFLFGTFGAADIMYAPVCTRLVTYRLPVGDVAGGYVERVMHHPWLRRWIAEANAELWVIDRFERPAARP